MADGLEAEVRGMGFSETNPFVVHPTMYRLLADRGVNLAILHETQPIPLMNGATFFQTSSVRAQ